MEELYNFLRTEGGKGEQLGRWEVLFALGLCFVCVFIITKLYRYTHKSASYSQSFVQTLFLTSLVTTLIMIVIGSNIARAFSLVGALSIIRFRNAVKETRDVGYIFFSMAIAMACGTRFYLLALIAVSFISTVMGLLHVFDYGNSKRPPERLLTVQLPTGVDPEQILEECFHGLFNSWSLVSLETTRQGMHLEAVYSVQAKESTTGAMVVDSITAINNNMKVIYNYSSNSDVL